MNIKELFYLESNGEVRYGNSMIRPKSIIVKTVLLVVRRNPASITRYFVTSLLSILPRFSLSLSLSVPSFVFLDFFHSLIYCFYIPFFIKHFISHFVVSSLVLFLPPSSRYLLSSPFIHFHLPLFSPHIQSPNFSPDPPVLHIISLSPSPPPDPSCLFPPPLPSPS